MELTKKRRGVFVKAVSILFFSLLLGTQLCQCTNSNYIEDVEPCFVNVIKSKLVFFNVTNLTTKCCDTWCTSYCSVNITVTHNMTVYYSDPQCCPGYQGITCKPYCSETCGLNKQCSQPDQCTCITGWSGDNCQRVANLTHSNITSSSIQLSWLSPANNNSKGYLLYCSNNSNTPHSLSINNKTISSSQNKSIITGLRPYTVYQCCVIPLLLNGNGTESCLMDVRTLEAAPSTAPLHLMAHNATNSSLLLQWTPPTTPNGKIRNYILYISYTNNQTARTTRTIDGQLTYYLLQGLPPLQRVQISVAAVTSAGKGPPSNSMIVVVDSSILLSPFTPQIDEEFKFLTVIPHGDHSSSPSSSSLTTLIWSPPSSLQSIASYFTLVLSNAIGSDHHKSSSSLYKQWQWTIAPRQVFNLTLLIEPFIPHQLNVTIVTTDQATGLVTSNVFFAREGVPRRSPLIKTISRISPTHGNISWSSLALNDSRGIIINYTITYSQSTSNLSCGNIVNDSTKTMTVIGANSTEVNSVMLSDLNIQTPYCITVLASTEVGPGPSSMNYLIPTFESNEFCLELKGVYNCSTWILTDLNEKLSNLTLSIVNALNSVCSCSVNIQNIPQTETQLSCLSGSYNSGGVKYCSRLIGTETIPSLRLIDHIREWSTNFQRDNPIILSGLSLQVTSVCNSRSGNCTGITNESTDETDIYKVTTLILGVSLVLVIVFQILTCVILISYCNKYYSKKSKEPIHPHLCLYATSSEGGSTKTGSDSPDTIQSPRDLIPPTRSTISSVS